MNRSIYLARLFGTVLALVGVAIVLRPDHFRDILKAFDANPALMYFAGLAALSMGVAVVIGHNVWTWRWPVLVTLIGWISLAKGIAILAAPQHMGAFGDAVFVAQDVLLGSGAGDAALGVVLALFGFLARSGSAAP
jgi:hypothetical protein